MGMAGGEELTSKKYLFVCGCARSGTSALATLVSKTPDVFVGMERYISIFKRTGALSQDLFEKERFLNIQKGDSHIEHFEGRAHYHNLREKLDSASIIGDKIPSLYRGYEMLLNNFPGCKIIFIYRNLFDVCDSWDRRAQEGKNWGEDRNWRIAIDEWNLSIQSTLKFAEAGSVLPVSYEDLFFGNSGAEDISDYLGVQVAQPQPISEIAEKTVNSVKSRDICAFGNFAAFKRLESIRLGQAESRKPPPRSTPARRKYDQDREVVDYTYTSVPGLSFDIRAVSGNKFEEGKSYDLLALGSAATFGRFVPEPFIEKVARVAQLDAFNLGFGGARPETYLLEPSACDLIVRSKSVLCEVMSARGYRNTVYSPCDHLSNMVVINEEFKDSGIFSDLRGRVFVDAVWARLKRAGELTLMEQIQGEILESYLSDVMTLAELNHDITFLRMSQRPARKDGDDFDYIFPHLITNSLLESLKNLGPVLDIVSTVGLPQKLLNAKTGEPVELMMGWPDKSSNAYYPSPEMHDLVAREYLSNIHQTLRVV